MFVFLDTMVYLHYKPTADIDWPTLLGASPVTICVPRITIRELDRHKNTHPIPTIRARAGRVLRQMEGWFEQESHSVRLETYVQYTDIVPDVEEHAINLDPSWSDDILIATILTFKASHSDSSVTLVTQDTGPRLTAYQAGIPVKRLDDVLKLPEVLGQVERENRQLKQELLRLQAASPTLSVEFKTTATTVLHTSVAEPAYVSEGDVERIVEEVAAKFPVKQKGMSLAEAVRIGVDEIERYNRDREQYLRNYRDYVMAVRDAENVRRRAVPITLRLRNSGRLPGEDIDIDLHFPLDAPVLTALPAAPAEPEPPVSPRSYLDAIMPMPNIPALSDLEFRSDVFPSNVSDPDIRQSGSYDVNIHVTKLKHGSSEDLPELFVLFDSREEAGSFGIAYTLTAANIPDPSRGRLDVVIK